MGKTLSPNCPWIYTAPISITCTWDVVRRLAILALLPISAAATFAGAFLFFYQGSYEPPPSVDIPFQQITSPAVAPDTPVDSGAAHGRRGLLLIDALHQNSFTASEIVTLTSWVANRGFDVEVIGSFTRVGLDVRLRLLEEKLRRADSFAVMLPREAYLEAEIDLVERFVEKGGKLLLISDPTRPNRINDLAKRFGLEFLPDYLYNTVEYDLNFRNIFVRDFQPDPLTNGLDTITLYIAGSVRSSGHGLVFTDTNTKSSLAEAAQDFYPIAWGDSRNVLAIGDFTFMVPPYNSLLDNDRLLSNLADHLTDSQREFDLADFPYFFEGAPDDSIDILLGQPSIWDIGIGVRNGLAAYGLSSGIRGVEDVSRDTVFVGLYEDALPVSQYLQAAGIRIDDVLSVPFAPDLSREGTAITLLHRDQDRHVLVVLADTTDALAGAVGGLLSGDFRKDLVGDFVGMRKSP
jgi:hypothetical protein